ncbi:hypothetical protein [Nocardia sp. NPDC052112]|uniref:alpha/beta hydrolase n=1 Tax=Nocardia sp. NPDC052112 TaxID=3155646 RepID=UPI00343D0641
MQRVELISVGGISLDAAAHPGSAPTARGTLLLVHGITVDMDEDSMFVRLADRAAETGFDVLRFSLRGHGSSGGTQQGVTIAVSAWTCRQLGGGRLPPEDVGRGGDGSTRASRR